MANKETETKPASIVTVRILKNGVHAGGMILGKGAVVTLQDAEAQGLADNHSAKKLN